MPTKPLKTILDRELSKAKAREVIEVASPLLKELVNEATTVLKRCELSSSAKNDEDLAILVLYRHIVEITDGIEVLVSQCCVKPASLLLRSAFEALLSIEYILKEKNQYVQRAHSWFVEYIHKSLDLCELFDSSTTQGKKFEKACNEDTIIAGRILIPSQIPKSFKHDMQSVLRKKYLKPIEAEYQKRKKKKQRRDWYTFFNGPGNLETLANKLGRGGQYQFLFRQWSNLIHCKALLPIVTTSDRFKVSSTIIRDPTNIDMVANCAASFLLDATSLILSKLRPGEDFDKWFRKEVRKLSLKLSNSLIEAKVGKVFYITLPLFPKTNYEWHLLPNPIEHILELIGINHKQLKDSRMEAIVIFKALRQGHTFMRFVCIDSATNKKAPIEDVYLGVIVE